MVPVQSHQELGLGVCVSGRLPGDLPGTRLGCHKVASSLSLQELEAAKSTYSDSGVPNLSKFHMNNYLKVAKC